MFFFFDWHEPMIKCEIIETIMEQNLSPDQKIHLAMEIFLDTVALIGVPEKDFRKLIISLERMYSGPFPDNFSDAYENFNNNY